eukprot:scaffold98162_cov16-Tisochrysis_lutea.AAC.1
MRPLSARGASTAGNGKLPKPAPRVEERQQQQKAEANQFKLLIGQQRADAERKRTGPQRFKKNAAFPLQGMTKVCKRSEQCRYLAATLLLLPCCSNIAAGSLYMQVYSTSHKLQNTFRGLPLREDTRHQEVDIEGGCGMKAGIIKETYIYISTARKARSRIEGQMQVQGIKTVDQNVSAGTFDSGAPSPAAFVLLAASRDQYLEVSEARGRICAASRDPTLQSAW